MPLTRRTKRGVALLGAMVACSTGAANPARAQSNETAAARADRLFHEGKVALEAGRYAEACPKLAESQQLDPGTGTLLALGLCHEADGKTASAWRELTEVRDASQRDGRGDRAALATKHLKALEPKLSKLTIAVSGVPTALRVRCDGQDVPAASWGQAVPVDPGDHVIDATQPGAPPWKTSVHVGPDGDAKRVEVPRLEYVGGPPKAPAPAPDSTQDTAPSRGDRTLAWIVGGAGVALLAVGGYFGVRALSDHGDATRLCPSSPCANPTGVSENDSAKTEAWVADVGIGLGLAGVAVGAYLLLRHEEPAPASAASALVVPTAGPGQAGLSFTSRW